MKDRKTFRGWGKPCGSRNRTGRKGIALSSVMHPMKREIERRRNTAALSTVENELTAYRSLMRFAEGCSGFVPLSPDTIRRYENWLIDGGVCANTAACYMRSLRSVFNRMELDGTRLFSGVRTARTATVKRSISGSEVRKVWQADLSDSPMLAFCRDMFIFSIYAMGIPFADLAALRKTDVRDGILSYDRRKTKRTANVRIEPCMQRIIDRYACKDSPYLFPLLRNGYSDYAGALSRYNRALCRLSERLGLSRRLTSYVPRHTWATAACRLGISLCTISKALTHGSLVTTQNYIRDLDDGEVFRANRRVLDNFFGKNKKKSGKILHG